MPTDATPRTPEPDQPRSAQIRAEDYPDPREVAQRAADETIGAEQSAALTDSGPDPHRLVDQIIGQIQADREATLRLHLDPEDRPLQLDVIRLPPPPDQPDRTDDGDAILVVRGELLLRVPAIPASGPEAGPDTFSASEEVPTESQRADTLLRQRGYESPLERAFRGPLPLRIYTARDRSADQLRQDRDDIRQLTNAEVDLNYVVTAGHLVKADDYPRLATTHRCYSPEWIRRHPWRRTINVAVVDTGVNHQGRSDGWLTTIPEDAGNEDPLDVFPVQDINGQITRGDGELDLSAGHGSFVAGVVQQVAPASDIRVYRKVDSQGAGSSDDVANGIIEAAADGADIINLSLGTMTVDNLPPLAFTAALDTVRAEHPGVVIVASAGNMGLDTPMFPAAMKDVVGVGALDKDLNPAPWSNHGFWVNCSSIGVGVTSTFVKGAEPPHTEGNTVVNVEFDENAWAIWSGTSFSAPQIAGAIAQLCQLAGIEPAEALDRLLTGRSTLPGYGYVVRILPGS